VVNKMPIAVQAKGQEVIMVNGRKQPTQPTLDGLDAMDGPMDQGWTTRVGHAMPCCLTPGV